MATSGNFKREEAIKEALAAAFRTGLQNKTTASLIKNKRDKWITIVILSALLLIGLALLVGGAYFIKRQVDFKRHSLPSIGTVIDYEPLRQSTNSFSRRARPIIQFVTADGRKIIFTNRSLWGAGPTIGSRQKIIYNPEAPSEAMIDSWIYVYLWPLITTGMGLIFVFSIIPFLIKTTFRRANKTF